ncbi:hypothetical protein C4K03_1484 [Pseudomonas synxantha]|uniref:Uncharacterized protein n=1 Tax=Pseudomonas synxantha TaxID=47883 RepID=A0A3G7U2Q4_9PSED|nr:hypothetical protein [Pseudomonas synxantha]AZE53655.1 hypothetical protein C4K03_1484 [Pseudomonas synxantha]
MTDNTELKRAASEAKNWGGEVGEGRWYTAECFKRPYFSIPDAEFIAACDPVAILALIAENERIAGDEEEASAVVERLAELLAGVSLAVRGPYLPLQRHSYHDLPERCTSLVSERDQIKGENQRQAAQFKKWQASHHANYCQVAEERDQLRAEVAGLRTGYEAYERVNAEIKAEMEVFRGLLREMRAIGNHAPAELTLRIDSAMGKGEKS